MVQLFGYILEFFEILVSFKAYVMLPIIMFFMAAILRMNIIKAIISSIKVGVGFSVIFLAFGFLLENIGPSVQQLIEVRNLDHSVLDVGWPLLAAITWTTSIAAITIPLFIFLNIVMLFFNLTNTVNLDIWNYWHISLLGAMVINITGNHFFGYLSVVLMSILVLKLADWSAPYVEKEADIHGISITTITGSALFPLGVVGDYIFDRIPGIKKIQVFPEQIKKRFELFSEPMLIGFFLGIFFGLLSGFDFRDTLTLSFHIATAMFILPLGGRLINTGLEPISLKLKDRISKRFPEKKSMRIGISTFALMENNAVLVTGLMLIPIALGLSFILPGNKMIPLGDLVNLLSAMSILALTTRGNVFRSVILGIPVVVGYLLIGTAMAPVFTRLSADFDLAIGYEYEGLISTFIDGGNPVRYFFVELFSGNIIAILLVPFIILLLYMTVKIAKKKGYLKP